MSELLIKNALPKIGTILRTYREKTGKYLGDIAKAADISVSMLSQIERGKVSPSIDTLLRVCSVLDLNAVDLFRRLPNQKPVVVHRPGSRLKSGRQGVIYELLVSSPDSAHPAEMFLLEVEPGKTVGLSGTGHEGVELGYVLAGKAMLTVDDEQVAIQEGDSISFSSEFPHELTNNSNDRFKAVWSVMPPHKDYLDLKE